MMLDIVEVFLKHHQYSYVRLDGRTNIPDRYVTFLLKMGEKKWMCVWRWEGTLPLFSIVQDSMVTGH